MQHRIPLRRKDHQDTLQSHWLVPVTLNGRGSFAFAVEPSRSRTLVSANTIENLGVASEALQSALHISEKLAYRLLRLHSIAVGDAMLNDLEIVVWGKPVIPAELLADSEEGVLYHLGTNPFTPISSVLECRGVLGFDFLRHFTVTFDFSDESLVLGR